MPKIWLPVVYTVVATMFFTLMVIPTAYADTKPYFRGLNGDVFAGGWFNDNDDPIACTNNYQGPTYGPTLGDKYNGAIMGFAQVTGAARTGASATMGAFATGLIEGADVASPLDYGFYSGLVPNSPPPPGTRGLSFANVDNFSQGSAFWGGTFEGADLKAHCIPDYYGTKQTDLAGGWTAGNYSQSGQRTWSGGSMPGGNVPVNNTLIVFASNDVTITGNVIYNSSNIDNIPKFALVVKGNIFIAPGVDRLDGWYIAQPDGTSGGVIWTCSDGTDPLPDTYLRDNCDNGLLINGALTAKQVNLSRIAGNLGGDSAEDVNYTPEMVLGGPFFEDETPGTAGTIQSLISLPPVF
jgi:hypothetical protein